MSFEIVEQINNTSHLKIPYEPEQKPWKDTLSLSLARSTKGHLHVSLPTNNPKVYDDCYSILGGIIAFWYHVSPTGLTEKQHDDDHKDAWTFFNFIK